MTKEAMDSKRIAGWLREHGWQDIVAFLLDVAGPFRILAAQTSYMIEPFFGGQNSIVHDLARILEDPSRVDALKDQLRRNSETDE
jgi:hypothetical protein